MKAFTGQGVPRFFIALIFASTIQGFGFFLSPVWAANCPNGLAGYWKLDETSAPFADAVGAPNGNDATCDTNCPAFDSNGAVNAARHFNGADTGILVPADSVYDWPADGSFSVELWAKTDAAVSGDGEVLAARSDPATLLSWKLSLTQNGTASFVLISTGGEGAGFAATGSKKIDNGVWHHIVAVRDAASETNALYVDGEQDAQTSQVTYQSGFGSTAAGLTFGWADASDNGRFSGDLDEIAVYNRALTENEIASHYFLAIGYCNLFDDHKIRIMPLGDSITYDKHSTPDWPSDDLRLSYRKSLWDSLSTDSYYIEFAGNKITGDRSTWDGRNAGFYGITPEGLDRILIDGYNTVTQQYETTSPSHDTTYLSEYPADVVLLHIGTNGILAKALPDIVADVSRILDQIYSYSSKITVVIALIINRVLDGSQYGTQEYIDRTTQFNAAVNDMVQARKDNGDKIIVVDMENGAGLVRREDTVAPYANGDYWDTMHPNPGGYPKMATQWVAALQTFLPQFQPPAIHSATTQLVATAGRPFEFVVESDGAPPPSFGLDDPKPDGMTIDPVKGIVRWTPQSLTGVTIAITATNSIPTGAGTASLSLSQASDTRSFDIAVQSAPAAASDAYGVAPGGTLTVGPADGVLANDTDADHDVLTAEIVSLPAHGTLSLNGDGSFNYVHDGGTSTTDTFTYAAGDGHVSSQPATVTINIAAGGNSSGSGGGGGCFIGSISRVKPMNRAAWLGWLFLMGLIHAGSAHGRSKD